MKKNFECDLQISYDPVPPEKSIQAFCESFDETSHMSYYIKQLPYLNSAYQHIIDKNIKQTKLNEHGLKSEDFYVSINGNQMLFQNKTPENIASHYEYGSSYGQQTIIPHNYIQPAVYQVGNQFANLIINETMNKYLFKTGQNPMKTKNKIHHSIYDTKKY